MHRFGLESTARASFGIYTTRDEIDALADTLTRVREFFSMRRPSRSFDDLRDLYQEVILDHGRHPRHARRLEAFDATAKGDNPMCGDRMEVLVKYAPDGTIADTGFEARGCAISVASADLMAETVDRPQQGRHARAVRCIPRAGAHRHVPALRRRTGRTDGTAGAAGRRARISIAGEMRDAAVARAGRGAGRRRRRRAVNDMSAPIRTPPGRRTARRAPKPTEDAIIAAIAERLRSGNPGEHLRTRPDLRDRHRR